MKKNNKLRCFAWWQWNININNNVNKNYNINNKSINIGEITCHYAWHGLKKNVCTFGVKINGLHFDMALVSQWSTKKITWLVIIKKMYHFVISYVYYLFYWISPNNA